MRILINLDWGDVLVRLDPAQIRRRARGAMLESLAMLQSMVQKATPVDTGISRGSIFMEMRGQTLPELHGIVASPLTHMTILEYGRAPGSSMPPVSVIEEWAGRNLGKRGLGYVVARAIARRGLPEHRMFRDAAEKGHAAVERIWTRWFSQP